jgi:hypothetical protein
LSAERARKAIKRNPGSASNPILPIVSNPRIAFDVHGLILDHRRAKLAYFRDVVGIAYSKPELQERSILEELAKQNFSEAQYRSALMAYSAWQPKEYTLTAGCHAFLSRMSLHAELLLITTSGFGNTKARVSRSLRSAGFSLDVPLALMPDASRIPFLAERKYCAYFDDKPNLLRRANQHGLVAVHVNAPHLTIRTAAAHFFFPSWEAADREFDTLIGAIIGRHSALQVVP